jgi:hypothetical protein
MENGDVSRSIELTPPTIHDASDGGLGYDDLARNPGRAVVVQTGPWGHIVPGDVIDVLWGPDLEIIASHRYEVADNILPQVAVEASTLSRYGEGMMRLAAQITLVGTGEVHRTGPAEVFVKFSVPGGLDPNPETTHRNEALRAPIVTPSPIPDDLDDVAVEVPVYANMSVGDLVTIQWHTKNLRYGPLTPGDIGKPVRIGVDKETVALAAGRDASVQYQIHDRVANWSLWSPPTTVDVPPDETSPAPPWVLGTTNDEGRVIALSVLGGADVVVRVESHPAKAGDDIEVTWDGITAAGKAVTFTSAPVRVVRDGQTLDVAVPNRFVTVLAAGRASAGYSIRTGGTVVAKSRRRHLSIEGVARELKEPRIIEAHNGVLDPHDVTTHASVVVEGWDGIDADDRCSLEWVGNREDGRHTFYDAVLSGGAVSPEGTLVFKVPASEVTQLAGGSLRVRYSVLTQAPVHYRDGTRTEPLASLTSPWLELQVAAVAAPLSIDSTPATLSGNMIRLEKPVTVPPEGTFLSRVASGGVPPYRYTASSGAVEVDEATGRVVSLRNGEATVTVTDARGQTASYPVTVSNVFHLVDHGSNDLWHEANRKTTAKKGRTPSPADWDAMRAAYGGAPGVRAAAAWTSQVTRLLFPKQQMRVVVFPNTGERQTRRAEGLGGPIESAAAWMAFVPKA